MGSKKPLFRIRPPLTGVRKDVDFMVSDDTMAVEGKNVIAFDGVIRPRPALTNAKFGTVDTPAWIRVYNDGDESGWHMMAFAESDTGDIVASFMNTAMTAQKFMASTDGGQSWQAWGTHPHAGVGGNTSPVIRWMRFIGGELFCYSNYHFIVDPATHTPDEFLYRYDVSTFWTPVEESFGPMEFNAKNTDDAEVADYWCTAIRPNWSQIKYDEVTACLVVTDSRNDEDGYPCVWYMDEALTTTAAASTVIHDVGGMYVKAGTSAYNYTPARFVQGEWVAYAENWNGYTFPATQYQVRLLARSMVWGGSAYTYGTYTSNVTVYSDISEINLTTSESFLSGEAHTCAEIEEDGATIWPIQIRKDTTRQYYWDFFKWKLGEPKLGTTVITAQTYSNFASTKLEELQWYGEVVAGRIVFMFVGPTDADVDPAEVAHKRALTSNTNGASWKLTGGSGGPTGSKIKHPHIFTNATTKRHFIGFQNSETTQDDVDDWRLTEVWLSPSSGGESREGDVTTLIQADMSDEDSVVFVGTTKALLRLDRDNLQWDRVTADHDQTVDTGATGAWVESGDIPPLSVTSERTEYVSGTSIAGAYGVNPWVFRVSELQGEACLIATNGQCRPIVYHPDMAGGFARRLGEVPVGDPNDINPWNADLYPSGYLRTGNLAPIAKALAVGAERVMLANIPALSPFAVQVSGFNDPDRGWGIEQKTLLGDTKGEIISANEISALSVAIYKTDAIYHAIAQTEFLGVAAPFRFELSKAGISGPCSPNSVLYGYDGRQIYFARDGGVYIYDGVAPIDGGRNIRRLIQPNLDLNYLGRCWGTVDYERKLVWFFYPSKDGLVNNGVVVSTDQDYPWPVWEIKLPYGWNFAAGGTVFFNDDINIGDVGRLGSYGDETLSSFSSGLQQILMGTNTNVWFSHKWEDDGDYTDDGDQIRVAFTNGWITPEGGGKWTADELYHIFSSPDPEMYLTIKLAAQQYGRGIRFSKSRYLYAGKMKRKTRHRITGTKFATEIRGGIDRIFKYGGSELRAARRGDR